MASQIPSSATAHRRSSIPFWVIIAIMAAVIITPLVLAAYSMLHV